jgi:hypothetical protein
MKQLKIIILIITCMTIMPIITHSQERFINNNDGTVTDRKTGLIWLENANCFGKKNWYNAIETAGNLSDGQCNLKDGSETGDWRLPSKEELWSLVNRKYKWPALSNAAGTGQWQEGDPFIGGQSYYYWSSSTSSSNDSYAWYVFTNLGYVNDRDKSNFHYYIWPVKSAKQKISRKNKTTAKQRYLKLTKPAGRSYL